MHVKEVESAIVDKLKADIEDIAVEPFPDKPSNYELIHSEWSNSYQL